MIITDWRELSPEAVAPLYEEQSGEWADVLGWDLAGSWAVVERARAAGALPGLVCRRGDGSIAAWSFFLRQDDVLQIGALVGKGATAVRELLEAILDSPEAAASRELTCLLFPAKPNALSALTRRRFDLQPQRYLARATAGVDATGLPEAVAAQATLRRWRDDDAVGCVHLLARAYRDEKAGKALAPHGTLVEWARYLGQLVRTPACGTLVPRASFVVEDNATGEAVGCVLTTSVGPATAHIAQIAVDPAWARRGVGRALVRSATRTAAADQMTRLTLLVSGDNAKAAGMYAAEGFQEAGQFVFASRLVPVRRHVGPRQHAQAA
jgi:ribosomal protein S18 acetylase RimI-like enzyme